jgi:hypothetical protein
MINQKKKKPKPMATGNMKQQKLQKKKAMVEAWARLRKLS